MKQRRRTRVISRKGVTVRWARGEGLGRIVNVSLKGCLVVAEVGPQPQPGDAVRVVIHLEEGAPEFDVTLDGRVARTDEASFAVDFLQVAPECFHHLFRLVQYNAEDPDGIEEELADSAFDEGPPWVS